MSLSSHQKNGGHDEWLTPPEIDLGVFSITVSERDSECTPQQEWALRLLMAAEQNGLDLVGPMTIEAA